MRPAFPIETVAPAPPAALLRRFDRGPSRDPALPALSDFSASFGPRDLREALERRGQALGRVGRLPLHLAVRVPCEGCLDRERSVRALASEARTLALAIGPAQRVARITFHGCGEATVDGAQVGELLDRIASQFLLEAVDVSMEARWPGRSALRAWRAAGATGLVLEGARPGELAMARELGFRSITAQVACGLRGQDGDVLSDELRALLDSGATRIHVQSHASMLDPSCDPPLAKAGPIASFEGRGVLRARAIDTMRHHGLRHVGLGLFGRAGDVLVAARERERLHLEVDGLAAGAAAGTLAIGAGAVGRIGSAYYRNAGGAREHATAVETHGLSVVAGTCLSAVAQARRSAVASLVCHGRLDYEAVSLACLVDPRRCFARELRELVPLVRAGLVCMDDEGVELTAQGEHLVDTVIAILDPGP